MEICEIKNITKSFKQKVLFENLSIKINEGDFICITGKSGKGKSTLLNIIGLLENVDSGEINICGYNNVKPNSKIAENLLKNKIGFIFQNFALIDNKTVGYNLDLLCQKKDLPKKEWKKEQEKALKSLELNVKLSDKIYNLSGGEQQRVALARIILKNCDIILADEPTGSLDTYNRDIVLKTLEYLNEQGKTIIIVTHDPYIIKKYENIIEL